MQMITLAMIIRLVVLMVVVLMVGMKRYSSVTQLQAGSQC